MHVYIIYPKEGSRLVVGWDWAAVAMVVEEFSQAIQAPSSTHPETTYPVRAIPHSDVVVLFLYFESQSL